jgi:TRAP-type C4-dicarboxylate transport system substrate-binding protein
VYQPAILVYSQKWFDTLSKDVQGQLLAKVAEETAAGRDDVRKIEPGLVQNFVAYGISVHDLSEAERGSFAAAAKQIRATFLKTTTAEGKRLLTAIDKAKADYKKQKK